MKVLYIVLGIVAVIVVLMIIIYNNASKKRLRVENAFSQIKIQCKKRADLVPYLADIVKSYASPSSSNSCNTSIKTEFDTPQSLSDAELHTNREIKSILMHAEQNPGIKADANFLQLQTELVKLEKAIAVSRGFYNDAVMMYNRTVRTFPANIVAKLFKLKPAEFIDPSESDAYSIIKGVKCPSCGAVSSSPTCPHCGTRIPLM